ncbi:hypothetical protein EBX93_11835, partial [bacterium]|nr:hypothetical protein [bacterium]
GVKDYVLADYTEYGWDSKLENTHLFGKNTYEYWYERYAPTEWLKFDNWVAENPPKLYLKRELLLKDKTDNIQPIEYEEEIIPEPAIVPFDVPTWRLRAILAISNLEQSVTDALDQLTEPQKTIAKRAWDFGRLPLGPSWCFASRLPTA